ncbi:uncharacterized protein KIAA1958-like [Sycon ciliatum]|uniref:uncharacterized protein KIAA1958-like n=1 Tax=Sycon ciliatum TaxID=27933 RepID=UPI0031F6AF47
MKWAVTIWDELRKSRTDTYPNEMLVAAVKAPIWEVGDIELVWLLQRFVLEIRDQKGQKYPGKTVHEIVVELQRAVREKRPSCAFFNSFEYKGFQDVMDTCMKESARTSTGQRRQAQPIWPKDEDKLWEAGGLGSDQPQQLLDTVFFLVGKNFALRSGEEHRSPRYLPNSQITLHEPEDGRSYLLYTEEVSKTNQGGLKSRKVQQKSVRAYDNPSCQPRCPVAIFKKYVAKRPSEAQAFYLKPLQKPTEQTWFGNVPLGKNTLRCMVADICSRGGLSGFFTNHSLRRTCATQLYDNGVDEQTIKEVTGHRSDAVRQYKVTSEKKTDGNI